MTGGVLTRQSNGRGCWYFVTIFYCPICAQDTTYRERRWTRKPSDPAKRVEFIESYDYCNAL